MCCHWGAIARAYGIPSEVLETLNDLDYGDWQWKTHEEIRSAFPDSYERWHKRPQLSRFPNGESLQELVARTGDALRHVLQEHRDQTFVLVGHDSVNRALITRILEQPLSAYWRTIFEPCGISEIDIVAGTFFVRRLNELFHLDNIAGQPSL